MVSRRYSGYLADDESLRGPQMRNLNTCQRRGTCDWHNLCRPPSRCQFKNPDMGASTSASGAFTCAKPGKRKRHKSSNAGESSHLAAEFSEFVDFLADEEVLDSLQSIMEDAVRKLRNVTTQDGEQLFDIQEDSCSSLDSESWSFSYSSTCSQSKYHTSTMSSSEDDWERRVKSRRQLKPEGRVCLLDKYKARLPKLEKTTRAGVSGGFHTETFSERSGDNYFFQQEHFHVWAKLAESFEQLQPPKKDYFAKFKKPLPEQSFSVESLHKEITNVLKRPTLSSIPLYYPGNQPFQALDFLEENKILAALQDIINQAVCQVLEATMTGGIPFLNLYDEDGRTLMPWDSSMAESEEEEEEEEKEKEEEESKGEEGMRAGSEGSGSGEETSEDDSKSEGSKTADGKKKKKKKKQKGKKKKKEKAESPMGEEKVKMKYTPPPLPKSKRKSLGPEEPQRKPKYVAPPLPKTKARPPAEEVPTKPKYVPPPLPKPKPKKQDSLQTESESSKLAIRARHVITPKDIKRARIHGRPLPKQTIIDFLIENAAKLILYKYNYETLLSEKLGFISVPVTKVLLEIMFGYKRIKGSGIRLSSQIDWAKVSEEVYAVRPRKPKTPKQKAGDKKKAGEKKKKVGDKQKKSGEKKSVFFKPEMPHGKVVVTRTPIVQGVEPRKKESAKSMKGREDPQVPEIFEIVPPQFPRESEMDDMFPDEEGEGPTESVSDALNSAERYVTSDGSSRKVSGITLDSEDQSPALSPKASLLSPKVSQVQDSDRGSRTVLPEVESMDSEDLSKKGTASRKSSVSGEGSKTVLPKI
ncbi:coiled-coil domain-containing protein 116 [Elgaria multicarinata webbii]|uniref:coiled-coil domain-containing protein 116 n=1 Tax=Elgaria multicarinata webbii TaxID=159646 RepID=UPI002FCD0C66